MSNVCISRSFTVALGPWISYLGTKSNSYLETVIRPAAKLHDTGLLVEWEVLDVNLARRLVDGGRLPLDEAVVPQGRLGRQGHLEIAVRTAIWRKMFEK